MKIAEDKLIKTKIQDLFAYRHLTDLFAQCGLRQGHPFLTALYKLQFQIYQLDAYLESNWNLEPEELERYWVAIREACKPFHFSEEKMHQLLKEIRNYERIESNCRKKIWPTEISFAQFYTTKSCDVRLIRHLLYAAYPELNQFCPERSWSYYDLITEINDDIADLYEDLETFNANRFLISILRKGHQRTHKSYSKFISQVAHEGNIIFKQNYQTGENAQVFDWTSDRVVETMALLDKTTATMDYKRCSVSLLLDKMN